MGWHRPHTGSAPAPWHLQEALSFPAGPRHPAGGLAHARERLASSIACASPLRPSVRTSSNNVCVCSVCQTPDGRRTYFKPLLLVDLLKIALFRNPIQAQRDRNNQTRTKRTLHVLIAQSARVLCGRADPGSDRARAVLELTLKPLEKYQVWDQTEMERRETTRPVCSPSAARVIEIKDIHARSLKTCVVVELSDKREGADWASCFCRVSTRCRSLCSSSQSPGFLSSSSSFLFTVFGACGLAALLLPPLLLSFALFFSLHPTSSLLFSTSLFPLRFDLKKLHSFTVPAHRDYISGPARRDYISGPARKDYIRSPACKDYISNPARRDYISNPARRDYIRSPAHRDYISGPARRDYISNPARRDYIRSPAHRDYISNPARRDYIRSPACKDYISGPARRDYIRNPARRDYISSPARRDYISNPARRDYIRNPARRDYIRSSARRDYISSPARRDYISGPAISDRYFKTLKDLTRLLYYIRMMESGLVCMTLECMRHEGECKDLTRLLYYIRMMESGLVCMTLECMRHEGECVCVEGESLSSTPYLEALRILERVSSESPHTRMLLFVLVWTWFCLNPEGFNEIALLHPHDGVRLGLHDAGVYASVRETLSSTPYLEALRILERVSSESPHVSSAV
ncbi:hypothetical protein P4O66_003464 [Electrophorus voltai]|uniref:Uncharacterized protein n=1 Tax=Electrophorus voltai TaxID=2609070 RepID=A0AAD8YS05_9TELE|nr:hypothetical protein P4O66_003464 [Electrophorus voltai]